jgi:hypothetical protein
MKIDGDFSPPVEKISPPLAAQNRNRWRLFSTGGEIFSTSPLL